MKTSMQSVILAHLLVVIVFTGCVSERGDKYMKKEFYNSSLYLFVHNLLCRNSAISDENIRGSILTTVAMTQGITNIWLLADNVSPSSKVKWEGGVFAGTNKIEAGYLHPKLEDFEYTKDLIQKTGIDRFLRLIMTGKIQKGISHEQMFKLMQDNYFRRRNGSEGIVYFVEPYGKPGGQPYVVLHAILKFENNKLQDLTIYGGPFK